MYNRRLFWLTAAVHGVNWVCFILSLFWIEMHRWMVLFGFPLLVFGLVMHSVMIKDGQFRVDAFGCRGGYRWKYTGWRTGVVVVAVCIAVLMIIISGTPKGNLMYRGEIIDGAYWLVNGSRRIRQITEKEYTGLILIDSARLYGMLLAITANPFAYYAEIRTLEKIKTMRKTLDRG